MSLFDEPLRRRPRKFYSPEPPSFECIGCEERFELEFQTPHKDENGEEFCDDCWDELESDK